MSLPRAQRRVGRDILLHYLKQCPFHLRSSWRRLLTSSRHSAPRTVSGSSNARRLLNVADACPIKRGIASRSPEVHCLDGERGQTCAFGRSLSLRTTTSLLRILRRP